jgi:hypothetical protein
MSDGAPVATVREYPVSFWLLTFIGVVTIGLVLLDGTLVLGNQSYETEINERQQAINQGVRLNQLANTVARALANQAVAHQNQALRDLLVHNGVAVDMHPATTSPVPASQPTGK